MAKPIQYCKVKKIKAFKFLNIKKINKIQFYTKLGAD